MAMAGSACRRMAVFLLLGLLLFNKSWAQSTAECELEMHGYKNGTYGVSYASLNCTILGQPNAALPVTVNETHIGKFAPKFAGVRLQKGNRSCDPVPDLAASALLSFCGNDSISFNRMHVDNVHFPLDMDFPQLYVLAFNGVKVVNILEGTFIGNQVSSIMHYSGSDTYANHDAYDDAYDAGPTKSAMKVTIGGRRRVVVEGNAGDSCTLADINNAVVDIRNLHAANNSAENLGGVLCVSSSRLSLTDSSFEGNLACSGDALDAFYSEVIVADSRFNANGRAFKNTSDCFLAGVPGGGAITFELGELNISHSNFTDNVARIGGAVCAQLPAAQVYIMGSSFARNTADVHGGALLLDKIDKFNVVNCSFIDNMAKYGGGGIMAFDVVGKNNITGTFFGNNTATTAGALGVHSTYVISTRSTHINNSAIMAPQSANSSYYTGDKDVTMDNTGGSISIINSTMSVINNTFSLNTAKKGGAIHVGGGGVLIINDNNFESNTARVRGAAISCDGDGTQLHVYDTLLVGCKVIGDLHAGGGGVDMQSGCVGELNRATLTSNSANSGELGGGGVLVENSLLKVTNGTVIENCSALASSGGGISLVGNSVLVVANSSLKENIAERGGALAVQSSNNTVDISTSILEGNIADTKYNAADMFITEGNLVMLDDNRLDLCNPRSVVWERSDCWVGEYLVNGICQRCPVNTFRVMSKGTVQLDCSPCLTNAYCPGGAVVVPQLSNWNGNNEHCSLRDVSRCYNPKACKRASHADEKAIVDLATELQCSNVSGKEWRKYEQLQCSEGYTGPMCTVCGDGYGQTDVFVCQQCFGSKQGDGRANNTMAQIMWVSLFGVAFIVAIWFTTTVSMAEARYMHTAYNNSDTSNMQLTDILKAFALYFNYAAGIIAKVPITWPGVLGNTFAAISDAWNLACGSSASLDCILPANSTRAGLKALLNLLAPFGMFMVVTMLQTATWLCVSWWHSVLRRRGGCVATVGKRLASWFAWAKASALYKHIAGLLSQPPPSLASHLKARMFATWLVTLFFWYPSLARIGIAVFVCAPVCQQSLWVMDMRFDCPLSSNGDPMQRQWALGVGIITLLLLVSMPVLKCTLLWLADNRGILHTEAFVNLCGFLFKDYSYQQYKSQAATTPAWTPLTLDGCGFTRAWHMVSHKVHVWSFKIWQVISGVWAYRLVLAWDAVIHCQTIVLTFIMVYGSLMHEYYQVLVLSAAFGWYLILVVWIKPFRGATQHLQAASMAVLFATSLSMLCFIPPVGVEQNELWFGRMTSAISILVLVTNVVFCAAVVWLGILCVMRQKRSDSNTAQV